jgi:hypothetical protein
MNQREIINRLFNIEASAEVLKNEATRLRKALTAGVSTPATRKGGLTAEDYAKIDMRFRKNQLKKRA